MLPTAFHRLTLVAGCFRATDQLMVAGTPLVAAGLFGAGPETVGLLIAAQGSAWLLASLPAGLAVDRMPPLQALARGLALSVLGVVIAVLGFAAGSLALFAAGAFLSACAAVIGFLSESASVQAVVPPEHLPRANARLQLMQSLAMLAGPAVMGYAVLKGQPFAAYGLAFALALAGLIVAGGFGSQPARPARARQPLREIAEGFLFVRGQPLLLGIVACALFWNLAFFALMAVFVPFALGPLGLDAGKAGAAQGAMGVGSLAAALLAGWVLARLAPRQVLYFGPASSLLAAVMLALSPAQAGFWVSVTAFLLLGFGPVLWLVCQNSIRQLVTPQGLLGRVGSVIQVAIYGVRSLGALLGGFTAAHLGFDAALWLIALLFAGSLALVALSALGSLRAMPSPA